MKDQISIGKLSKGQYREMLCALLDMPLFVKMTEKQLEEECISKGYLVRK